MCELLALSSSRPAHLTFSLQTLAARGGAAGSSHDGWGVAFYQGRDVALFREPSAAADSPLVHYLESQGPATDLAISHIRHATQGDVSLANTQPFVRELGGRTHVFAHNGNLPAISGCKSLSLGDDYRPVGQTDSEHAFCALLGRMASLWRDGAVPPLQGRLTVLAAFAAELRTLGPANFLFADGDTLFAHAHRRLQRNGHAEPPGLWIRQRRCPADGVQVDRGAGASVRAGWTSVVWIASVPLTEDEWRPMSCGELIAVRDGEIAGNLPESVA